MSLNVYLKQNISNPFHPKSLSNFGTCTTEEMKELFKRFYLSQADDSSALLFISYRLDN